jgi:hypothetical protein
MALERPNRARLEYADYQVDPQKKTNVAKPSVGQNYEPNRKKTQSSVPAESLVGHRMLAPACPDARLRPTPPSNPCGLSSHRLNFRQHFTGTFVGRQSWRVLSVAA